MGGNIICVMPTLLSYELFCQSMHVVDVHLILAFKRKNVQATGRQTTAFVFILRALHILNGAFENGSFLGTELFDILKSWSVCTGYFDRPNNLY